MKKSNEAMLVQRDRETDGAYPGAPIASVSENFGLRSSSVMRERRKERERVR